ncbi:hypothetical protein LSH36_56g01003 [Paralvinella palmiformis]|uniref:Uncharacterized protein n=1 Tax=Paralvinella palmiformis TaxID=53620 RepID=A0AAD9NE70_9ANNE|nr:hypothetical protein LSH36_56g01003 [Paralvinella palmiformis]
MCLFLYSLLVIGDGWIGEEVFRALLKAGKKSNVKLRIAQNSFSKGLPRSNDTRDLAKQGEIARIHRDGIQHDGLVLLFGENPQAVA